MLTFGAWLKNQRQCKNISLVEVSRRLGKPGNQYVCGVESDKWRPKEESLKAISKAYGISIKELRLAMGEIPKGYHEGVRRNMARVRSFLEKMQKV